MDAVAASLAEFGFRQPIVTDEAGVIIVGHTRWKAAKKLGLAKAPVHVARDLTPEQARAYRIADNKTAELAEWDAEVLPIELNELREGGFDMDVLAFDEEQLGQLLRSAQNHRLMCGDSGSVDDLDRLLDGATVDLVNMDPPYNVRRRLRSANAIAAGLSRFRKKKAQLRHPGLGKARGAYHPPKPSQKMRAKDRPLENDSVSAEAFDEMLLAWFSNASRVLKRGGSFYIWGGYANLANYPAPLKAAGLYFSQGIVWDKQVPVQGRKDFMGMYEICFYGWKEGAGHQFYGPNNATDLWRVKKVNPQSMVHLTEKPVELAVRAIQYSSRAGENVLDLFGGSGSTLIGCEQTGRRAFLMEIDPLYCDVIVQRWEEFTGGKAERIAATESPKSTPVPTGTGAERES